MKLFTMIMIAVLVNIVLVLVNTAKAEVFTCKTGTNPQVTGYGSTSTEALSDMRMKCVTSLRSKYELVNNIITPEDRDSMFIDVCINRECDKAMKGKL